MRQFFVKFPVKSGFLEIFFMGRGRGRCRPPQGSGTHWPRGRWWRAAAQQQSPCKTVPDQAEGHTMSPGGLQSGTRNEWKLGHFIKG